MTSRPKKLGDKGAEGTNRSQSGAFNVKGLTLQALNDIASDKSRPASQRKRARTEINLRHDDDLTKSVVKSRNKR